MENGLKKVLAVHDVSCYGKCSLTVALPIISSAGIETAIIPTAVLSTHTGGFTGFTFKDLTDEILPVAKHWQGYDIEFDAIYSGYLGSKEQIAILGELIDMYNHDGCTVLIDPVMADGGKLYYVCDEDFAVRMAKLFAKAAIIVPNITDAVFMTDSEYMEAPHTKAYVDALVRQTASLGAKKVVLTGVSFDEKELGVATYEDGEITYMFEERIPTAYHGTGDVYASALLCGIELGFSLGDSAKIAMQYVVECMKKTRSMYGDTHYGVNFETCTPFLLKKLNLI